MKEEKVEEDERKKPDEGEIGRERAEESLDCYCRIKDVRLRRFPSYIPLHHYRIPGSPGAPSSQTSERNTNSRIWKSATPLRRSLTGLAGTAAYPICSEFPSVGIRMPRGARVRNVRDVRTYIRMYVCMYVSTYRRAAALAAFFTRCEIAR